MTQQRIRSIDAGEVQLGKLLTAECDSVKETMVEQRHTKLTNKLMDEWELN